MLLNTGFDPVPSKQGLLTTVGYKLSPEDSRLHVFGENRAMKH